MISRRWVGRLRAAGAAAALTMMVVGCQSLVSGNPTVNRADVPAYRASVSSSRAEASSQSRASESRRRVAAAKAAVHASCDPLSTSSVNAVDAVNAFVTAFNENRADVDGKIGPAVNALKSSADLVERSLTDALPVELHDALVGWVGAARDVANVIGGAMDLDAFNTAINRLNEVKSRALNLCDASY